MSTEQGEPKVIIIDRKLERIQKRKDREVSLELMLGFMKDLADSIQEHEPVFYPELDIQHHLKVNKEWGTLYGKKYWYDEFGLLKPRPTKEMNILQRVNKSRILSPVITLHSNHIPTREPEIDVDPKDIRWATIHRRDIQELLVEGLKELGINGLVINIDDPIGKKK